MNAIETPQRIPGVTGTEVARGEHSRIDVRTPDGRLAYRISETRIPILTQAGLADEIKSPTGILRYLRLHRSLPEYAHLISWAPEVSDSFTVMQGRRL